MPYAGEPDGALRDGPSTAGPLVLAFVLLLLAVLEVFR
jgi:hypothetical protein